MKDIFKKKQEVTEKFIKPSVYEKKGDINEMNREENTENKMPINELRLLEQRIEKLEAMINKKIELNSKRIQSQGTKVK